QRGEAGEVREHHRHRLADPRLAAVRVAQPRPARRAEVGVLGGDPTAAGAGWHCAESKTGGRPRCDFAEAGLTGAPAIYTAISSGSPGHGHGSMPSGRVTQSVPAHVAGPGAKSAPASARTSHHHSRSRSSRLYSRDVLRPWTPFWLIAAITV